MKNFVRRFAGLLIVAIAFVIWNILVFTIADLGKQSTFFWVGYAFIFLAFLLVAGSMFALRLKKNVTFSMAYPCYLVVGIYFAVIFIMDSIFMGFGTHSNKVAVVVPNVILLLIFVALFILTFFGLAHIENNNKVIKEKVGGLKKTVIALDQIANRAADPAVKSELAKLSEAVNYSDPMGNAETADLEAQFDQRVSSIRLMVMDNMPEETILKAIEAASFLLEERNATLRVTK